VWGYREKKEVGRRELRASRVDRVFGLFPSFSCWRGVETRRRKKREDLLAKHAVSAVATFYALSPAAGSVDLSIGAGCGEELRPAYGEVRSVYGL
jgi:hypothetical protein